MFLPEHYGVSLYVKYMQISSSEDIFQISVLPIFLLESFVFYCWLYILSYKRYSIIRFVLNVFITRRMTIIASLSSFNSLQTCASTNRAPIYEMLLFSVSQTLAVRLLSEFVQNKLACVSLQHPKC